MQLVSDSRVCFGSPNFHLLNTRNPKPYTPLAALLLGMFAIKPARVGCLTGQAACCRNETDKRCLGERVEELSIYTYVVLHLHTQLPGPD